MKKLKLGIIDSSELLHRAKFVSIKENNDIFVLFLSYLQDIQSKFRFDRIVLTNDTTTSRYRKTIDPEYKEHRGKYDKPPTPKEIEAKKLMSKLRKNLSLLSPYFIYGGVEFVESDDIIGILYNDKELQENFDMIVVSGDKDIMTIVPYNHIYRPIQNKFRSKEDTKGLSKNGFLMYQSFLSDSTDTLITLKGIGESTALKLAKKFKNFKELKEFLNDTYNWENESDRYLKKAYQVLATKEGWETLGKIFKLVQIFDNTDKLNESELEEYNKVKENILNYEAVEFTVSEELDNFCLENNFDMDCYDMLEGLVSDFK